MNIGAINKAFDCTLSVLEELTNDPKNNTKTDEERDFLNFLREKFGSHCKYMKDVIEAVDKYTNDYNNIPYDKIYHETGIQQTDMKMAIEAAIEYQSSLTQKRKDTALVVEQERAIQDLKGLLELLEKKIKGDLDETGKKILKDNAKKWKEDIMILRTYIEQGLEKI